MKLSTRLLVVLLPTVAAIMVLYGSWAVEQRADALTVLAERETRAYSAAVGAAFEHAFRNLEFEDVQRLLDEVGGDPAVHGVLVYRADGSPDVLSEDVDSADAIASDRVAAVAARGETAEMHRLLDQGEEVFSVLRPLRGPGGRVTGVLEVMQPLSFVEAEKSRTSQRFLLNTLTLLAVVSVLVVFLVRRLVGGPLGRLVAAIRRFATGDLSQRVREERTGRELAELAAEFNLMAGRLEGARAALLRETEERLAMEHRVREAEKLAAVGTLAAGVAHQIASPLSVIAGRAQLVRRRTPADSEAAKNLRVIETETERISWIVRNLLDFARRPDAKIQSLRIAGVVERARGLLEGEFRQAEIEFRYQEDGEVWVDADPDLLQEVMVILFLNAVHALQEVRDDRRIEVRIRRDRDEGVVDVADTGTGIADDDLARIFEPFYTTKEGGTGLGLAVARRVVEQLGGSLSASSGRSANGGEPERHEASRRAGAVFHLRLPGAPEAKEDSILAATDDGDA